MDIANSILQLRHGDSEIKSLVEINMLGRDRARIQPPAQQVLEPHSAHATELNCPQN